MAATRNTALGILDSNYIACVDADDKLVPHAIENALERAYSADADAVEVRVTRFVDGSGQVFKDMKPDDCLNTPISKIFCQPTFFVYKRSFFKNIIFPVGYWYEDVIFEALIFPQVKKFASLSAPYYLYRQRPGSITQSVCNPKQLDSLYSGMMAISDSIRLGLWNSDSNREYLTSLCFHIVRVTFARTCRFPVNIRKGIFVKWCGFIKDIFDILQPVDSADSRIFSAIKANDYRKYELACILDFFLGSKA